MNAGCASAFAAKKPAKGITYKTVFTGVKDRNVLGLLKETSNLVRLEKTIPVSWVSLRHRAKEDEGKVLKVLKAFGYYDAKVTSKIHQKEKKVQVIIEQGAPYKLNSYTVSYVGAGPSPVTPSNRRLGIKLQEPAVAETIIDADEKLVSELANVGHPFATILYRQNQINYQTKSIDPIVHVDQGPKVTFGALTIVGYDKVREQYVRNRLAWKEGDLFDQSKIDKARRTLIESRQFKGVEFIKPSQPDEKGALPITLKVAEAKFKTVEAGLGYNMDESFKVKVGWEHRNLTGRSDTLRTELSRSNLELKGGIKHILPDVFSLKNTLLSSAEIEQEEAEAYKSTSLGATSILERRFGNGFLVSGGVSGEAGRSERQNLKTDYQLVGLPLLLGLQRVANSLDPTRGFKTEISLHPQIGNIGDRDYFMTTRISQSVYVALDKARKVVVAAWGKVNFITGGNQISLPANKLLYAGGSGSVRGYRYQRLGPLDSSGDPTGGRSSTQVGVEGRIKVHPKFSLVPFYEGANVRADPTPNLKQDFLWGYGIGARYHLDFAPVRIDLAFPQKVRRVNGKRRDSRVNLYFSIGQAF